MSHPLLLLQTRARLPERDSVGRGLAAHRLVVHALPDVVQVIGGDLVGGDQQPEPARVAAGHGVGEHLRCPPPPHARQLRADPGDGHVLDEEVRSLHQDVVDTARHVPSQEVDRPADVLGERWLVPDRLTRVELGGGIPIRLGVVDDVAEDGAPLVLVVLDERHQVVHVDEEVVVGLEQEAGLGTERVEPLQGGQRLQRQVVVVVDEVGLHDVGEVVGLALDVGLHAGVVGAGHEEGEHHVWPVDGGAGPGAAQHAADGGVSGPTQHHHHQPDVVSAAGAQVVGRDPEPGLVVVPRQHCLGRVSVGAVIAVRI